MPYVSPTEYSNLMEACLKAEKADALQEVLRRYAIMQDGDGYEALAKEFGECAHPESSYWMEEWLDRVLRYPLEIVTKYGYLVCSCADQLTTGIMPGTVGKCAKCGNTK